MDIKLEQLQEALTWFNEYASHRELCHMRNDNKASQKIWENKKVIFNTVGQALEQAIEIAKGEAWVMRFKPIKEAPSKGLFLASYENLKSKKRCAEVKTNLEIPFLPYNRKKKEFIAKPTHFATFNNNNGEIPVPKGGSNDSA